MKKWEITAESIYFEKHLSIVETAHRVNKTRQTVAAFLKSCPKWSEEKEFRRRESLKRRKRSQRIWDQLNRVTEADVKRDHFTAAAELSAEKYH